jgi:hypothetical protein
LPSTGEEEGRGVIPHSSDFYLPSLRVDEGAEGQHPVYSMTMYTMTSMLQERRDKNMALVMQMYPDVGFNGSLSTYHGSQFI